MTSYFTPELSPSHSSHSVEGSQSSISPFQRYSANGSNNCAGNSIFEASRERLRGSPAARPVFQPQPEEQHHEQDLDLGALDGEPSEFMRRMLRPMEERRREPGCGINEFDSFDKPVRAETSPVRREEIFGPRVRCYARDLERRKRQPPSFSFLSRLTHRAAQQPRERPLSAILQSSDSWRREYEEQRKGNVIRDPRYPFFTGHISPLSLTSSSSSSSSSSSGSQSPLIPFQEFQPIAQSSPLQGTPPRRPIQGRSIREDQHPAYIPSYVVRSGSEYPSRYIPSPSSSSDVSVFHRTPEKTYDVAPRKHPSAGFGKTYVHDSSKYRRRLYFDDSLDKFKNLNIS